MALNDNVRLRREICRILVAMSAGEASDEQCARLDALVRDDSFARQCVVDAITQMSDLEWEVRESMPAFNAVAGASGSQPAAVAPAPHRADPARRAGKVPSHWSLWRRPWGSVAAFLLGVAATLLLVFRLGFQRVDDVFVAEKLEPSRPATQAVARLVSNTSYLIDSQGGHAINTGDAIHAGRSVALFEGVAEVEFNNSVSIRLKGPALLAIDDDGIAHMKYGRLIVTNQGNRPFTLELPLATTMIAPDSYVGVDGHGDDVFVYAFEGQAELTPLRSTEKHLIAAKYGLRARRGARSEIVFTSLQANSTAFDFDLLMASDQITVAPEYAAMIVADAPTAYYRFEEADADVVKNEMGARHALEAKGDGVRITSRDGGGVAEFVLRDDAACLTSPEPFDELDGDYTIEMWVKPSHYQWGTLAALLERDHDEEGEIDRHALIVELQGANAPPEGSAKSLRFLHRSPPSEERGGTSCFSSAFYRAQSWQHVAAVKRGDQLNLYLNGELVASAVDATCLPQGLQLVIGQLFSFGTVRPFVGHIDELAIYARALSAEEIRRHIAMMRSTPAAPLKSQD